jgi:hypothetical protein
MPDIEEDAMGLRSPRGDAPSLEGLLRTDMGVPVAPLPSLADHAIRGSVILTRSDSDPVNFPPSDACGRQWARAPRPPAINAQSDPDG